MPDTIRTTDVQLDRTWQGEGTTAHGAMLSLLARRLGIAAEDVVL